MNANNDMRIPPPIVHEYADVLPRAGESNWGMAAFGVQELRNAVAGAPTLKIGVVDDGCNYEHAGFRDRNGVSVVKGFRSFIGRDVRRGRHGTHTAGTIGAVDPAIGMMPNVELYVAQGLDPDSGSGSMTALMAGIEWCLAQGCVIVSNSWGGGTLTAADDRRFREWAEHSSKPWLGFAAGNSGPNTPNADAPGVSMHLFNWAALNMALQAASFTNNGTKLDAAFSGVDIWSLNRDGGYVRMSGTSMATPGGNGVFGLFRQGCLKYDRPIMNVYELRAWAATWATDVHTPGDDLRTGPGYPTPVFLKHYLTPDAPAPQS